MVDVAVNADLAGHQLDFCRVLHIAILFPAVCACDFPEQGLFLMLDITILIRFSGQKFTTLGIHVLLYHTGNRVCSKFAD